ncbi:MAG TPA: hypothetical protein VNZ25_03240 [Candidatus Angelobacter sp.]|nr:hypothetical protein [Candidatus Angelobacter sp.]
MLQWLSVRRDRRIGLWAICLWLVTVAGAPARIVLDPNDPLGFFSTLADKMLRNTFSFGVTNIPVYVNGQFVYTPAVNRVLQLAANIYDASNTNFYPSVYRPLFEHDGLGNVFVVGFTNLSNGINANAVTGLLDAQLSAPFDPSSLVNYGGFAQSIAPMMINGVGVNVYGVPWIIGAKKGFPAFNKFGMQTIVQATRKLQITRSSIPTDVPLTKFTTNQLIAFNIQNLLNVDCWNSYTNAYTNEVVIQANDYLSMEISNSVAGAPPNYFNNFLTSSRTFINAWPGYNPPNFTALSFTNLFSTSVPLLTNDDFYFGLNLAGARGFYPDSYGYGWESNNFNLTFPEFTLFATNRLQLFMLDMSTPASGYHVIDYVQLGGPATAVDLTAAIETNNATAVGYGPNMWSQATDTSGLFYGIKSQITVSESPITSYNGNGYWLGGAASLNNQANVEGFSVFMGLTPGPYPGSASPNNPAYGAYLSYATNYVAQVPYTPTVTVSDYTAWQVNDPLVHYLASDLTFNGTEKNGVQTGLQLSYNGIGNNPQPQYPSFNVVNDRYQPWSMAHTNNLPAAGPNAIVPSAFGLAIKDPWVWGSDYWNFPTNLLADLTGLGQVHRGTPWQTIYLKADDVLNILDSYGDLNSGTNTWVGWTGDNDIADAATMAPVNDWRLASLMIALLNTNNVSQKLSVNDPNPADWLNVLNGLTVYSNSTIIPNFNPKFGIIPAITFDTFLMGSNSLQAEIIAVGIAQAKGAEPNQDFTSVGEILSVSELTVDSPWLNTSPGEQEAGITDAVYEAIPSQLLLLLRPDSIGAMYPTNGGVNLQFSGSDAWSYVVQQSPDLVNWTAFSTNHPAQGVFNVSIPSIPASSQQFYRSLLLP